AGQHRQPGAKQHDHRQRLVWRVFDRRLRRNTIAGNTITHSGKHGIYIKTGKNTITQNTVSDNGSSVGGSGIATLHETTLAAAAADLTLPGGHVSLAASAPELLGAPALASLIDGNIITQNTLIHNIGS